jgi:hypothetical protein
MSIGRVVAGSQLPDNQVETYDSLYVSIEICDCSSGVLHPYSCNGSRTRVQEIMGNVGIVW